MGILQNYIGNGSEYKSLKFGKDQPDGGSSKQPFMQKDINKAQPIQPGLIDYPSVLRGGIYSEVLAATDVARLTKYFTTPGGIQFALNQNILSNLAPRTEASGVLNEYIYTPLSTLAQAGVGNLGIHLNKQGLDPTGLTDYSIKKYGEVVYTNNLDDPNQYVSNRLVDLHFLHIENPSEYDTNILTYRGGPGSILGIGKTKISFATNPDGTTSRLMGSNEKDPKTYLIQGRDTKNISSSNPKFQQQIAKLSTAQSGSIFGITNKYTNLKSGSFNELSGDWEVNGHLSIPYTASRNDWKSYLTPSSAFSSQYSQPYKDDIAAQTTSSYSSQINPYLIANGRAIVDSTSYNKDLQTLSAYYSGSNTPIGQYNSTNSLIVDPAPSNATPEKKWHLHKNGYLANLDKSAGYYVDPITKAVKYDPTLLDNHGIGPDFRTTNRNIRGFGDQTSLTSSYDYITEHSNYWTNKNTVDRIYYNSGNKRESTAFGSTTDLIKFNIGIINLYSPTPSTKKKDESTTSKGKSKSTTSKDNKSKTDSTKTKVIPNPLTFRAYIDNLSDSYDADWSAQTYMGRGEKLWKYNSFGRTISLGFTVVAEGPDHLKDMYNHLNILASSLAPSYTGNGYMAGNIHKLTIGNYINNQYGIITGLTYEIINESPWEINTDSELPHIIKVTGFKFTPIHNFRPEYKTETPHNYIAQNTSINTKHPAYTPPK